MMEEKTEIPTNAEKAIATLNACVTGVKHLLEDWKNLEPAAKAQICDVAEALGKIAADVKVLAGMDIGNGIAIEDPEHKLFFALQERAGRLVLETAKVKALLEKRGVADRFAECVDVSVTKTTAVLRSAGMPSEVARAMLEDCGTRGAPSTSFVRRKVM